MGSETQPEVLDLGKGDFMSFSQREFSGDLQPHGQGKLSGSLELQLCSRSQTRFLEAIIKM